MAQRILAAAFPLTIADVHVPNTAAARDAGAAVAADPAAVAAGADTIITCVPGPKEVEAVFFASDGLLAHARPGTVFIEMSTIDVALSRRIAAASSERGLRYIDAPISGGVAGAVAGTLTVMVGGDAATLDAARPLLGVLADRVVHLGAVGSGHFAKLVNQVMYLGYVALFCEAVSAADAYGISRADLIDVLRHSVGGHPLSINFEERLLTRDRTPGFDIARVLKDLRLGAQAYGDVASPAPILRRRSPRSKARPRTATPAKI